MKWYCAAFLIGWHFLMVYLAFRRGWIAGQIEMNEEYLRRLRFLDEHGGELKPEERKILAKCGMEEDDSCP